MNVLLFLKHLFLIKKHLGIYIILTFVIQKLSPEGEYDVVNYGLSKFY